MTFISGSLFQKQVGYLPCCFCQTIHWVLPPLVGTDKCFVSFSTCNPNTCSHWLTQSQKEADIYYLFIIGWHTLYFSSYWLSFIDLTLLHMSRLRWKLVLVENYIFVTSNRGWSWGTQLFTDINRNISNRIPTWCISIGFTFSYFMLSWDFIGEILKYSFCERLPFLCAQN